MRFQLVSMYDMLCCTSCNATIRKAIFGQTFSQNLTNVLLPFVIISVCVGGLAIWSAVSHQRFIHSSRGAYLSTPVPLGAAAMVLGIGLGGFIDGIVFHQILQWHSMVSNKLPLTTLENKSINMFWDGIFHLFTFITIVAGIIMLWRLQDRKDAIRSTDLLIGGLCLGWGFFNIVEGVIDHHILKLHNVREVAASVELWNSWFLGASFCLFAAGLYICTAARRQVFIKA